MKSVVIKRIYIDRELLAEKPVRRILERSGSGREIEIVDDAREILEARIRGGERGQEKESLLVYRYPGKFLSPCPGSDGMVCCRYFVINTGVGCLYDCRYCFLQQFMNHSIITVHGNQSDLLAEIGQRLRNLKVPLRIGTGEYSDSLALEELTGMAGDLVEFFADWDTVTLELKTKSARVESLLDLPGREKTVISWSLNPAWIIDELELHTASLEERLQAARMAAGAGYRIAFHLDPIIHTDTWEADYHRLLDQLFEAVDPARIAWISLGGFRYAAGLKEEIQARYPHDFITRAEMFQGPDGKHRYFKQIRREIYDSLVGKIKSADRDLFVYLCMETRQMWNGVFGGAPESAGKLDALFEERRRFQEAQESR